MSLLQRVNFSGNVVCNNSVYFFFYFCQTGCFLSRLLLSIPHLPPLLFPPTLIHMELRKEAAGKGLSREVGYVSESNLNSL